MAKTVAERQAIYRQNRVHAGDNGERRINTWVTTGCYLALRRLAQRYGVTNREMLEKLVGEADQAIVSRLDPDLPEWSAHFIVTPAALRLPDDSLLRNPSAGSPSGTKL